MLQIQATRFRLDSMLRELRKLLCYDKTRLFFLGKCVGTAAKAMVVDRKKTEGASSAIFGIGTAAKYCELKRYADSVRSTEPTTKMKS